MNKRENEIDAKVAHNVNDFVMWAKTQFCGTIDIWEQGKISYLCQDHNIIGRIQKAKVAE